MMIDRVGGINPGYGPRKNSGPVKADQAAKPGDNVVISEEASRAASSARIQKIVQTAEDPARVEKLNEVRAKLANGDYNDMTDQMLDAVADKVADSFLQ